jgi:hypothetical protein
MSFDATTALWTVIGNAEEVGRTRARQEIIELLREQGTDGMSPREVAEALEKNYHTTCSLMRKMEETGEVTRLHGRYLVLSGERNHQGQRQPSQGNDDREGHLESHQTMGFASAGVDGSDDYESASQSDETDYTDYGNDTWDGAPNPVERQPDYTDYGNDVNACVNLRRNKFDPPLFSTCSYSQLTTSKVHAHVCAATQQMNAATPPCGKSSPPGHAVVDGWRRDERTRDILQSLPRSLVSSAKPTTGVQVVRPAAPQCLDSLTPDASRARPLHPRSQQCASSPAQVWRAPR